MEFPHKAPEGYSYELQPNFQSNVTAIWLKNNRKFDYNLGASTRTIWGFYNTKKRQFFAPINSKKIGKVVDISYTTPYTAMTIKRTPLEEAFS